MPELFNCAPMTLMLKTDPVMKRELQKMSRVHKVMTGVSGKL